MAARVNVTGPKPSKRDLWPIVVFGLVLLSIASSKLFGVGRAEHGGQFIWFLGVALVVLCFFTWMVRRAARFAGENNAALEALRAGRVEEARERFEALATRWRWPLDLNRVAHLNLAWAELLLGEVDHARVRLAALETRRPRKTNPLSNLITTRLAFADALAGDVASARERLEQARARPAATRSDASLGAFEVGAESIADCREGHPQHAATELASRWLELENGLTGELLRPFRVLRAFAVEAASPANDAEVEMLLAPLRASPTADLAFLGARWPEMRAFLERRRIV